MLVISRKPGESLILSDNIKITILSTGHDKVTIGIDAPRSVPIIREELLETIQANKESTNHGNNPHYKEIALMLKSSKIDGRG